MINIGYGYWILDITSIFPEHQIDPEIGIKFGKNIAPVIVRPDF